MKKHVWHLIDEVTEVEIPPGWYRMKLRGETVAAAIVFGMEAPIVYDFVLTQTVPVYIKLLAGNYRIKLMDSLRWRYARKAQIELKKLNWVEQCAFLLRKLADNFQRGDGLGALGPKIRRALNPKASFGSQIGSLPQTAPEPFAMGPLSRADWEQRTNIATQMDYRERVEAVTGRICFYTRIKGEGENLSQSLKTQIFKDWTCADECTGKEIIYTLFADSEDRLTPDALLLLAEKCISNQDAKLVFADVWDAQGRHVVKFGFDPLIHKTGDDLSLPFVLKGCVENSAGPLGLRDFSQNEATRLSIPIAEKSENYAFTAPAANPPSPSEPGHRISVIIPTRDRAGLLRVCLEGLFEQTLGQLEIIIVDNGSVEPETHALFAQARQRGAQVLRDDGDFNFSRLCNLGARSAQGEIVAFVNNDIKVIRSDWLLNMSVWAMRPDVGAVGTRLFYEDDTLQHGGISLALSGAAGHLFRGLPRRACEEIPTLAYPSHRMAVTAAVLLVEKAKFDAIEGFDETHFPVSLNDVDLCLRLRVNGWLTVYEPRGEAYHLESQSRKPDEEPSQIIRRNREIRAFRLRWESVFSEDLWFSPVLCVTREMPHLY